MNFFGKLHDLAQAKFQASGDNLPMSDWMRAHTTIARRPFSFKRYPFQEKIAADLHPNQTIKKCSQIGISEIKIRQFLAFLRRNNGTSGIFTLPNEDMAKRMYTTRISPILKEDEVFNPPMNEKPVRRRDLVQIQNSWGYITPCNEGPATSIAADILMHDEVNLSDEQMLVLFQSRVQNSEYKITHGFSTPTYMGYGIDKSIQNTDQFHYMTQCGSCNHWQFPKFEHKFIHIPNLNFDVEELTDMTSAQITGLDIEEAYVKCEKCSERLDLSDISKREWVAKYPSRTTFRGYILNPFVSDRISLQYIFTQMAKYKEKENEKGFHNTVLGEAFSPSSAQIKEEDIKACFAASGNEVEVGEYTQAFLGIDIGIICHLSLVAEHTEGKDPWLLFKTCHISQLTAEIAELDKRYNILQACIDRYPYTTEADALRINSNGRIMPIHYAGEAPIAPKKDELGDIIYYKANRTFALDMVKSSIENQYAILGGYGSNKETLVIHLRDMLREENADSPPKWLKLNGNDHFFHSMGYALISRRVAEHQYTQKIQRGHGSVVAISGIDIGKQNDNDGLYQLKGIKNYGFR